MKARGIDRKQVGTNDAVRLMPATAFQHEALLYSGANGFVDACSAFIMEGLASAEPVLVAVIPQKIEALRDELGDDAASVRFVDMAEVGRNPARIIPVWRDFLDSNSGGGRRVRGIGEPIWAGRSEDELVESQRHEFLINQAFDGAPGTILCPYDISSLPAAVIEEARRSHPVVVTGADRSISLDFQDVRPSLERALSEPPADTVGVVVVSGHVDRARATVAALGSTFGLDPSRNADLVLAVDEAIANSIRHGGGRARLLMWLASDEVVCQIEDSGHIDDPLVGRRRPDVSNNHGYGLWIVNQLCDLVQIRSVPTGTVVRLHMSRT